jgi:hypothetical protein
MMANDKPTDNRQRSLLQASLRSITDNDTAAWRELSSGPQGDCTYVGESYGTGIKVCPYTMQGPGKTIENSSRFCCIFAYIGAIINPVRHTDDEHNACAA